jgi:hypothetical protein
MALRTQYLLETESIQKLRVLQKLRLMVPQSRQKLVSAILTLIFVITTVICSLRVAKVFPSCH